MRKLTISLLLSLLLAVPLLAQRNHGGGGERRGAPHQYGGQPRQSGAVVQRQSQRSGQAPQREQHAYGGHEGRFRTEGGIYGKVPPQREQYAYGGHREGRFGGYGGGRYGRMPESRYRSHFGQEHRFRIGRSSWGGYHRFWYGGYWFGFNYWPYGWGYEDDCYVVWDEGCGCYWLYNVRYPGVHIIVNLF